MKRNTIMLSVGLVVLGGLAFVGYKMYKKAQEKKGTDESSFDGEFSYARGGRGRVPSVAKASGCVQTAQIPYPKICNGQCISCATNCKDCMKVRKRLGMSTFVDNY